MNRASLEKPISGNLRARGWIRPGLLLLLLILFSAACLPNSAGEAPAATPTSLAVESPIAPTEEPTDISPATETPLPTTQTETPFPPQPTPTSPPPTPPPAAQLPDPDGYIWTLVTASLRRPVALAHAEDGSGRLFVVEQSGSILLLKDGQLAPAPFLDISDRAVVNANEQGLLGLAFHPQYAENGYFYVNYTNPAGDTVISRFQVGEDPDRADSDSEVPLLNVRQPYPNHNGGGLAFGPDGYLYMGLGDGGSAGDPQGNAQSLDTLLGKLLRVDVDAAKTYAIPEDNPFSAGPGRPEIWAYGLRNPWRFTFDAVTGDLYIADVGQNVWEEVNYLPADAAGGANFGWDYREAAHPFEGQPPADLTLVDPVAEYDHGLGCSITGGVVYRGGTLPEWQGVYLYGDYCSGRVWGLLRNMDGSWQNRQLYSLDARISSFGVDGEGEVYLVDHRGRLFRLERK